MRKLVLFFAVLFIIGYISLIQVVATNLYGLARSELEEETVMSEGEAIRIGFEDSLQVTLRRDRWYGTIIENLGKEPQKMANLYLFNAVKIPIEVNTLTLVPYHIGAILFTLVLLAYSFTTKKEGGIYA